jgi:hypothetical protein
MKFSGSFQRNTPRETPPGYSEAIKKSIFVFSQISLAGLLANRMGVAGFGAAS